MPFPETNRGLRELADQQREVQAQLTELGEASQHKSAILAGQQERLARLLYQQYTGAQPDALKLLLNAKMPVRSRAICIT